MRIHVCTVCRKVSSAKKQPTSHKRWVRKGEPGYDDAKNENPFADVPDYAYGHFVTCGPFETYIAVPESELTGVITMGV
jgi:hypothetical protein